MKWIPLCLALLFAAEAQAQGVRRFALLVGTNDGGRERVRLQYAVTDARNVSHVLSELGGVAPEDAVLLEEADRAAVLRGLEALQRRVERARASGQRTEAILYYSGHSDETGLLLRGEHLAFGEFRRALEAVPADVRVAVLDSCASGALARRKGGERRPAFLLDASHDLRGQAILTSSSADEASQESDRIGASYFTHHLVSGLRGAADASGDGKVTLSEAYQFAFRETLARTEGTQAGPQHPVYDIDLVGSGDLVLTDLRVQRAGLAFAGDVAGRLFVRDASDRLVVELRKSEGETVEVGLGEGRYSVFRQDAGGGFARAQVRVAKGGRVTVAERDFLGVPVEATVRRGGEVAATARRAFLNLGLVPFASTNDLFDGPVENHFSFGLIGTRAARVDGLALGLAMHWTDGAAHGAQVAGAFNAVGGEASGGQLAGALNVQRGDFTGAQVGGAANVSLASVRGVQLAGAFNLAGGEATGVQLAGAINLAQRMRGLQLSGLLNRAGAMQGLQLGVINVGGEVTGAQVGVLNIGSRVRGAQFGVVNVGGEVEGASVGLLSFVRNGQFHVEAFASDITPVNVAVKLGSRHAYTSFGLGRFLAVPGREERWAAQLGFGAHVPFGRFFVDGDLNWVSLHDARWVTGNRQLAQLRIIGGYRLGERFAIVGGPTGNVAWEIGARQAPDFTLLPTWRVGRATVWPGLQLGVRY